MAKKYFILVFGCQMNKADAERAERVLVDLGYEKTDREEAADLAVMVACSVRQSAVDRVYGKLRPWQARRRAGDLKTVLTGCVLPPDCRKLADKFDVILPISQIGALKKSLAGRRVGSRLGSSGNYFHIPPRYNSRFQAYVPIMTGCDNFCSYCVVPYVRGREVSRSADEIIRECAALVEKGYKEITLIGQNVNSYKSEAKGKKLKGKRNTRRIDFARLLGEIDRISGDYWLRFATSHPKDLSDDLIKAMARGCHITPYLHLPVQAGDNKILKAMNRGYTARHYLGLIEKARKARPEIMISTDVIVGFPGETRAQFNRTKNLFNKVKFDMAYIAEYSPRPGTAAARLNDDVSRLEKKRRREELTAILEKTALAHNRRQLGRTMEVLVEDCQKNRCLGKTNTFKTVSFWGGRDLVGRFVKVRIKKADSWGLFGEIVG